MSCEEKANGSSKRESGYRSPQHNGNSRKGITIAVEDRGIGILDESKKRVFDKYYRVPVGNLHDVKGFGLGLSYVKLMVEAHGGTVSLESEYGKGTTVEVFLSLKSRSEVGNHG